MIANTLVTALIAASFMAGSQASPCKASSRTTDISTTVGITLTSAEAPGTTETVVSTTGVSSVEDTTLTISQAETSTGSYAISEDVIPTALSITDLDSSIVETSTVTSTVSEAIITTSGLTTETNSITIETSTESTIPEDSIATAISTTDLSSTIIDGSTETSTISDGAATTVVSITDLSSSIVDTNSETSTVPEDITTTAIPTTSAESLTAVEKTTTTTTEAAVFTGFLVNSGLDDTDTVQPWGHSPRAFTSFTIDSNTKHDGRHSARLTSSRPGNFGIGQYLVAPVQAGVNYLGTAWIRPGTGCHTASLACTYAEGFGAKESYFSLTSPNQWTQISFTCVYNQNHIDRGSLALFLGFSCLASCSTSWVDTITFDKQ
ncbi:hypothetical protein HYE67_004873 [Fusarium culmorum]|uniref:CBM-cenC domain-containing protein n=1 Tax=Fusarium culmorum TaxID=5516 RepID=A0A7S8D5Z4_FUSCU|nr:hypothetical protein HYE67_004873 [Fusarium culmorum]